MNESATQRRDKTDNEAGIYPCPIDIPTAAAGESEKSVDERYVDSHCRLIGVAYSKHQPDYRSVVFQARAVHEAGRTAV
jgi:hypothetical protein